MITMLILLFNLLIALMGDSFDRTKQNIEAHYWRELASFLVDQSMPTPFVIFLQATGSMIYEKDDFVHVIKYASDVKLTASNFKNTRLGDAAVSSQEEEGGIEEENEATPKQISPLEKAFNISAKLVRSNISERQQLKLSKKSFVDDDIIDRKNARNMDAPPTPTETLTTPTAKSPTVTTATTSTTTPVPDSAPTPTPTPQTTAQQESAASGNIVL
jgi:hypothetical protein